MVGKVIVDSTTDGDSETDVVSSVLLVVRTGTSEVDSVADSVGADVEASLVTLVVFAELVGSEMVASVEETSTVVFAEVVSVGVISEVELPDAVSVGSSEVVALADTVSVGSSDVVVLPDIVSVGRISVELPEDVSLALASVDVALAEIVSVGTTVASEVDAAEISVALAELVLVEIVVVLPQASTLMVMVTGAAHVGFPLTV